jgi:hypothetical protein
MTTLLLCLASAVLGAGLMFFAARFRYRIKLDVMRREMGMKAFTNGVALGLEVPRARPVLHPLGHRVEHWTLPNEQSVIDQLTSRATSHDDVDHR